METVVSRTLFLNLRKELRNITVAVETKISGIKGGRGDGRVLGPRFIQNVVGKGHQSEKRGLVNCKSRVSRG